MIKKVVPAFFLLALLLSCFWNSGGEVNPNQQHVTLSSIKVDSSEILKGNPLWPDATPQNYHDNISYSKKSLRTGKVRFDDNTYQIAILNSPGFYPLLKYGDVSHIWIDRNQNNKYDFTQDVFEQMYLPFTIRSMSYQVTQIDSLGNEILVEACDPTKYPPIEIGLPAPDFKDVTIDSTDFQLSQLLGHPVFLYFWACNPFFHKPIIEKVAKHFSNTDLRIVCIGNYSTSVTKQSDNSDKLNWIHINKGNPRYEARIKYQVGALPKLFIIDKKGIIRSINIEFMGEKLIEIAEKYI